MLKQEQIAQINLMNWVKFNLPEYVEDIIHVANERTCSPIEGRILKRMGVRRGCADIFVAVVKNGIGGLWLELKVGTNKPTKEQQEFLQRKIKMGYAAACVWGWEAARDFIVEYLRD